MERKDFNKVGTVQHSLPGRKTCREMLALQAEELRGGVVLGGGKLSRSAHSLPEAKFLKSRFNVPLYLLSASATA